ncbi:proline dehydrogenase family protein [Kamptonema cortianum]|nr:proline dehydrogenase family protein [Geitlerinema splendidum]MDK3155884.1 proline dehydrogenase family protein [Kamptonema cortianum]
MFRPVVSRFIAGESLDEAMKVGEELAASGFGVSLDLLGENVSSVEEADQSTDAYIEVIEKIAKSPYKGQINISIKLTALGLDQGADIAEKNYRRLLESAHPHGIFIRADMEGSAYTERTVALVEQVFKDYCNTGTVLQSYLYRTDADIERLLKLGCRVRIVKGAYLEPVSVAHQAKSVVDSQYEEHAQKLMLRGKYPAIATHDEAIVRRLIAFATERGLPPGSYEWQMLFGIRRDLQQELLDAGHKVRIYVPYGQAWYPYFTRRLAERPANVFFILKSLLKK